MPVPFVDAQDLTDYLGRDVTSDPGALIALDAACDTCRLIAEQDFNAGTVTVSLDGTGGDSLVLPRFPVNNAGTVLVNGGTITDYMLTDNGLLLRGTAGGTPRPTWPKGRQNVQVTYGFGYELDSIPRDVRACALQFAARMLIQGVASSESVGGASMSYSYGAGDVSPSEDRILKKYRRARSF